MDKFLLGLFIIWISFIAFQALGVVAKNALQGAASGARVLNQSWQYIDLPSRRLAWFFVAGLLIIIAGTPTILLWQLEEVVQDHPYIGWAFAGLLIGTTTSALIRWQLLSWPHIADKPARIQTLDAIKAGASLARRNFVFRIIITIITWSLLLLGLWANQGTGKYPWTATFKEKVILVEQGNETHVPFLLNDALGDGMRRLESPINNEDGVAAHAEVLRLFSVIQRTARIQSYKERASTMLMSYQSMAESLIKKPLESNSDQGLYMAKALAASGDAHGYMLIGHAYENGDSLDKIDFRFAYEAYQKAAEQGLSEGEKAANELIKGLLESSRWSENVVGYELLEEQAEAGDPIAQLWMGHMNRIGAGVVPIDIDEARYWYSLASKQEGHDEARKRALLGLQVLDRQKQLDKHAKILTIGKGSVKVVPKKSGQTDSPSLSDRSTSEMASVPNLGEVVNPEPQANDMLKSDANTSSPPIEESSNSTNYLSTVQRIIQERWLAIPVQAQAEIVGSTFVRFHVDRLGKVSEVKIEHSSGDDSYDEAARRAVINANLPAFSPEMPDAFLVAHMKFSVGR